MHLTDAGMGEKSPLWSTGKDPPREANVAGGCLNLKGMAGPQTARMLSFFFFFLQKVAIHSAPSSTAAWGYFSPGTEFHIPLCRTS